MDTSSGVVPEKGLLGPRREHKMKGNFDFDELDCDEEEDHRRKTESFKRQKIQPAAESYTRPKLGSTSAVESSDIAEGMHDNLLEDSLLSASKVSAF
jgi:hypothetical protein